MLVPGIVAGKASGGGYTGPLDLVPGAVVAYGQRALSAAKLGTALYTIREDGGNTTQSFNSDATTGDAPVAAITTFLNGANGYVTTWNDQSGNAVTIAQATALNQPSWIASAQNNRPAIGPAVNHASLASTSQVAINGQWTSFHVVRSPDAFLTLFDNATAATLACSFAGSDPTQSIYFDAFVNADENGDQTTGQSFGTAYHLVEFLVQANSVAVNIDGVNQVMTGQFGNGVFPAMSMNVFIPGSGSSDVNRSAEHIVYASLLSGANRLAIRQNMATYYGITLA